MTALPRHKLTADEFLAWAETLPPEAGRFELWDGVVVVKRGPAGAMNSERSQHWEAKGIIYSALKDAVRRAGIEAHATGEGPSVRISNDRLVEPDALVYLGPKVPRGVLEVPNPVIVVEILSPSTAARDLGAKRDGYFSLTSVQHYLTIDPDSLTVTHHTRAAAGILSRSVDGPILRLDPPGLDVDLSELRSS